MKSSKKIQLLSFLLISVILNPISGQSLYTRSSSRSNSYTNEDTNQGHRTTDGDSSDIIINQFIQRALNRAFDTENQDQKLTSDTVFQQFTITNRTKKVVFTPIEHVDRGASPSISRIYDISVDLRKLLEDDDLKADDSSEDLIVTTTEWVDDPPPVKLRSRVDISVRQPSRKLQPSTSTTTIAPQILPSRKR